MAREYAKISVASIIVEREKRQRRVVGTVQDLADSISRIGLINPITITRENVLIAGERRLEACKLLSEEFKISVRYVDELAPTELQLIELDENLKRSQLDWKDEARAVKAMHLLLCEINGPSWTQEKSAEYMGMAASHLTNHMSLAANLDNEKVAKADNLTTALNVIARETERAVDNELNMLNQIMEPAMAGPRDETDSKPKAKSKIFNEDFCSWAQSYNGQKFNFLHCDFPYGIDHQKSEQGNIAGGTFHGYHDSEQTYWKLCKALCENMDKILLPSAHVMFWFSMKFYSQTIDFITQHSNLELVDERPLIWFKSDNKGIVSDVTRRPRNVYESALLFSRGDRKIISPVANTYACPTSKTFHASEKPEPMLRHFFRMFCDEYSEVLDPTCGSGTAIRAAFELGAKRAIGLEINPEFAQSADAALTRAKGLKQLEKEKSDV